MASGDAGSEGVHILQEDVKERPFVPSGVAGSEIELQEIQDLAAAEYRSIRPWLGSRSGSFDVTWETVLVLVLMTVLVAVSSVIGVWMEWALLGALVALLLVVIPLKWFFLFYIAEHERDASLFLVTRVFMAGFVLSAIVTTTIDVGALLGLSPAFAALGIGSLVPLVQFSAYTVCEVLLAVAVLWIVAHSRHFVNFYSGFVYGMSFGVGYGCYTAALHVLFLYLRDYKETEAVLPYFLWVLRHMYSMNMTMACCVWIGLGMGKRKFRRRHSQKPLYSWPRIVIPPLIAREVFLLLVSIMPNMLFIYEKETAQVPKSYLAIVTLWLDVCQDLIGIVFFVFILLFLFMQRRILTEALKAYLPDPMLHYPGPSDEIGQFNASNIDADDLQLNSDIA